MRITVVGGGIVGLSCAHRLAEAGHEVGVVAAGKPEDSTSAIAGGLIYPPGTQPADRVARWTVAGVAQFRRLGAPGVRMVRGRLVLPEQTPEPAWAAAMEDVVVSGPALEFTTALVDTPVYLAWLAGRVAALGVRTEYRTLSSLGEVDAELVVNAAGLGGGALAGDDSVVPVGGQVVHLADPGLTEWVVHETDSAVTYVIPHGRHVVCGGTEEEGRIGVEPDAAVAADIVARCRALVPALAGARVLGTKVGLRPHRPQVRLDRVGDVVHCYGHGGAGITLSWGCADEVAALAGS
ncbi:FAD-dependent oxidoreductase [Amycolatopsis sp. H20-H5]|uniref:FAD-dependent oxidoreductase n=1 Tax=Amycolatopsis sp. H20-H5 TaxID=3046309 RepID=UPI002DBD0B6D|nr:FAD-dependent oxidoreductase [Amycolatopsis sp. H20-H5]MEC3981101.1 FAD-dependent oxidoreductase [Amycolatopsis sp. H20-H5]